MQAGKILFTILISVAVFSASAQTDDSFTPGYYIVNSKAEFTVLYPGSHDYYRDKIDTEYFHLKTNMRVLTGEIVIAYEKSKGKYFCFDPVGRMYAFRGANPLTKAPIAPNSGVGQMNETIQLIDGSSLGKGSFLWIIGQNLANSTIKVQVADGATYDIPQSKITLLSVSLHKEVDKLGEDAFKITK